MKWAQSGQCRVSNYIFGTKWFNLINIWECMLTITLKILCLIQGTVPGQYNPKSDG